MRYIVTGGAGFIGSNLAHKLVFSGKRVCIIDNLSTGELGNIRNLLTHPLCTFIQADINNVFAWHGIPEEGDVIFHCAATVGVNKVCMDPFDTLNNNLYGTQAVLDVASRARCKVIYASSSEVYGESPQIKKETDALSVYADQGGRSSYVLSKLLGEHLCFNYKDKYKLPVIICRFFNVAGINQSARYGMVVPTFVQQALQGEPITVFGDGEQKRSFCDVRDLSDALLKLANCGKAWGHIFNIGNTETITINELAKFIKEITNSSSTVTYVPLPFERCNGKDIYQRTPSIEKIQRFTGWKPLISWNDTIRHFVENAPKSTQAPSLNVFSNEKLIYS
jgi:UDP-glucose 4-epimerase